MQAGRDGAQPAETTSIEARDALRSKLSPWTASSQVIAVTVAVGATCLHLMGTISQRTYLKAMGVDSELFPKSTEWLVINGYYVLADRFIAGLNTVSAHWWRFLVIMFATILYLFCVKWVGRKIKNRPPAWIKRKPLWQQELVSTTFIVVGLFLSVPTALLFAMLLILLPAALGEMAGTDAAAQNLTEYQEGCSPTSQCLRLHKDSELILTGFLIDSSTAHIALFNVTDGRAHTIERKGTELLGYVPSRQGSK